MKQQQGIADAKDSVGSVSKCDPEQHSAAQRGRGHEPSEPPTRRISLRSAIARLNSTLTTEHASALQCV